MPKLSPEKKLEWEERIRNQRESGLSIEKWCQQNQILPHRFYYWRDRLLPKLGLDRSSFTELVQTKGSGICIEYHGIRIHLERNFDPSILKECLSVLKELKC